MDAREERPELRTFKGNPFEQVLANRGRYIRAALVVVLAYRAAGMPGRLPPIGDPFAEWSDNVRSALVWLGRADPVETMEVARERDIYRQARMALLQALLNAYGSEPRTAARR
jgi:putative DNA primase/helicase